MANVDAPFGLMPVRHLNGNSWNGATIRCRIHEDDTTALFVGDPVVLQSDTDIRYTSGKMPTVMRSGGVDGSYIFGVITSFDVYHSDLTRLHSPASTAGYCNVCVAPDVIYWIQDEGTAALTKDDIGANAIGTFTEAGDTTTGISGYELDAGVGTTPGQDVSNCLLILGVADVEDNEFDGSTSINVIWEVMINLHQLRPTGDGSGALGEMGG